MTLVEVVVALFVFAMLLIGILSVLLQTRRLSAASIAQNCALIIIQGYIEQIKNLPLQQFVNANPTDPLNNPQLTSSFDLPTLKDPVNTDIVLSTTPSSVDATTLTGGTLGITPSGVVDNLETFDLDSTIGSTATTWAAVWPGARNYPTTTPGKADLHLNIWVQISDLTPTASAKSKAYGILVVYTWQYIDGGRIRYAKDSIRAIRSAVQTF